MFYSDTFFFCGCEYHLQGSDPIGFTNFLGLSNVMYNRTPLPSHFIYAINFSSLKENWIRSRWRNAEFVSLV